MEKAKKKRLSQHGTFAKSLNTLNELLKAGEDQKRISIAYQILEEKKNDLDATTNSVLDLLLDVPTTTNEQIQQEYDDADEYKSKFLTAKLAVADYVSSKADCVSSTTFSSGQGEVRKAFKLPKIEIFKFGGDVRDWLQFWSLFKKIHEDPDIAKEDKFQYLSQAMVPSSRAAELVKSYPPTGENYAKVITSLKNRFGRDDLQIEMYVRELLQLVLQNAVTPAKDVLLSSLYDKIESQLRALESLGVTTDKCAAMLLPLVESSLPEELLRAWQRNSPVRSTMTQDGEDTTQANDRLTQLIQFLEEEVQNELRISMVMKGFGLITSKNTEFEMSRNTKVRTERKDVPSDMGLLITKGKSSSCLFCNSGNHESASCEYAKGMSLSERQECVRKNHACFNCLKIGHGFKMCRVNSRCPLCYRRHVILMCPEMTKPDEPNQDNNFKSTATIKGKNLAAFCGDPEVLMQTLRVKLRNGNREIIIRAVIDTGSQKSYVTEEAAARAFYEPIAERQMIHSLFGGQKTGAVNHKKYIVHLRSMDDSYDCNFVALDQKVICEEIPAVRGEAWLEELRKVNIAITDTVSDGTSISVLIGVDVAGKLLTGQRYLLESGLVALETLLGWTIMGAVPEMEKREDATLIATSMFEQTNDVTDLWALDTLGIKDPIEGKRQNEQEEEINEALLETVKVDEEGRYGVQLPLLENHPVFNDNKELAVRRLQSTVKKLKLEELY